MLLSCDGVAFTMHSIGQLGCMQTCYFGNLTCFLYRESNDSIYKGNSATAVPYYVAQSQTLTCSTGVCRAHVENCGF